MAQAQFAKTYWWRKSSSAPKPKTYWWQEANKQETAVSADSDLCLLETPKPGDLCPYCQEGTLAYDGLFLLTCDKCKKVAEGGCFT